MTKINPYLMPSWKAVRSALVCAGFCLAVNNGFAATPLLDFEFDEGSGATITDKVSKLVGTLGPQVDPANDPLVVTDTPSGAAGDKAVSLNIGNATSSAFLVVNDSTNPILTLATNAFTMEAWIKVDATDLRQFEGIGAYGGSYKMGLNNGQLLFTLYGIVDIPSGIQVPLDSWHHVAAVWEPGTGVTFYLDGGSATPVAETRLPRAFNNNYLTIGAEGVGGNAVQGVIDRFRIHRAALTADQLDSVAATPKAPLTSTLVAYDFSESAAPFQSAASTARPAITANEYQATVARPTFITDTPSGKAGDFALNFAAGQNATVSDPDGLVKLNPDAASFTAQAWVKFGAQPGVRSVLFFNNAPGGALSFSVTGASRHVFVTTLGIVDQDSNAVIPDDGGWHHIAVVEEFGKEFRFYVDGVLGDTVPYTTGVIFTRTDTTFTLGSEPGGGLQYVGAMDRFRFSAEALTADQLDFWPVPGVPPSAPSVNIATAIQVSWPTVPAGYQLQSSTDLNDPKNWVTVTNKPSVANGTYFFLYPSSGTKTFYRLIKP